LLAKFIFFQQAILIKKFVAELITGLIEENKWTTVLPLIIQHKKLATTIG
jgi:hypothetical protein